MTDGVEESLSAEDELFGNERVLATIRAGQGGPAKIMVYNILGQEIMSRSVNILNIGDLFLDLDFTELDKGLLSSGMLFVAVESSNHKVVRKCIMLKN